LIAAEIEKVGPFLEWWFIMRAIRSSLEWRAKRAIDSLPSSLQTPMNRILNTYSDLTLWPLRNKLNHEITAMEWRKSEERLRGLKDFPEMRESAWRDLGSLGYELVRYYKPKVAVELGTHVGLSALAMGLALRDLDQGGKLYAVDTWQGDEHSGLYSDEVYNTFLDRCARLGLDSVIVPLRMTFDEARDQVPDQIDLLHIDGLHTWDAVSHDFETYSPLVRTGASSCSTT
jgi:predicted O-methyltransferase YrrM